MKKLLLCAGLGLSALCAQAQTKVKPATTAAAATLTTQPAESRSNVIKTSYDVVGEVNNIQYEVYSSTNLLTGAKSKWMRIEGYNQTSQTAVNPACLLTVLETDALIKFLDAVIPEITTPQKPNTVYSMTTAADDFSLYVIMQGDEWNVMMSLNPNNRNATFRIPIDKLGAIKQNVTAVRSKLALND